MRRPPQTASLHSLAQLILAWSNPWHLQVNNLIATSVLLVRMKRREIAYRARQQGRQAGRQPQAEGGTDASEPKKDK